MKPVVRAIVYFTRMVESGEELKREVEEGSLLLNTIEDEIKANGFSVFTKRLSFPGLSVNLSEKLVEYLEKEFIASIGYSRGLSPEVIVKLASLGLYVPLLHPGDPDVNSAKTYSEVFHRASSIDPLLATRIAVGFHDTSFQTPYFPDSSSSGFGEIGMSFLYANSMLEALRTGLDFNSAFRLVFYEIRRLAVLAKLLTGLKVKVDYSLSPWMENSVAGIYEYLGYSLVNPGSLYFTWVLNNYIHKFMDVEFATGFNEVMLPYAEDSLLKEYGFKGFMKARDFVSHASTCVAGVDMVVVPESRENLARLITDAMAIAHMKSRPMSIRVIPVPGEPGEVVDLGRFGRVPVIPY